jgi:broad specificity phosphatase PhoE
VRRVLAAHPGARVCLVGHGDQIRLLLTAFLGLDSGEFRRLRIDTCGLSAVEIEGERTEVKFVNLLADPGRVWEPLHWGA